MTNNTDKKPVTETDETDIIKRTGSIRRIMAWIMLICFLLLVINILFLHKMIAETAILYMALVAVFFLGNGARGGAKRYVGQEQGDSGEEHEREQGDSGDEFESVEELESGKDSESGANRLEKHRETGAGKPG